VGEARLEQFGILTDENGKVREDQTIEVGATSLTVVGTFRTGTRLYDNAIIVRMEAMSAIRGGEDVANLIAVRVEEGASVDEVTRRVEADLPDVTTVRNLQDLAKVDKSLQRMRTISLIISIAATILGLLFILLAMVMSVFERTREIGILRSVGWHKRRIVQLVLVEALVMAALGVLVGIPTGLGLVELISALTDLSDFIQPSYEIDLFLKAIGVALAAACVGGIYPAWRASRLHPVEAIRHE
jgi:putative ABC transport system permease protein